MVDTLEPITRAGAPRYKRALLKLSGEVLLGNEGYGIDACTVNNLAAELVDVRRLGVELAVVIGGGNIFRGIKGTAFGIDRVSADYMGMLATIMNAIALQDAIERQGEVVRIVSALSIKEVAEPYIRRRAVRHLEKGRILIFAAGTGSPYFTTDTAASLRAMEINAEIILKGTKVDGVYSADPHENAMAERFDELGFTEALNRKLAIMDATAFSLCRDNHMSIIVFDVTESGNLVRVIKGEPIGTLVHEEDSSC